MKKYAQNPKYKNVPTCIWFQMNNLHSPLEHVCCQFFMNVSLTVILIFLEIGIISGIKCLPDLSNRSLIVIFYFVAIIYF